MGKQSRYANVNKAVEGGSCLFQTSALPESSGKGIEAFPQKKEGQNTQKTSADPAWIKLQKEEKAQEKPKESWEDKWREIKVT